MFRTASSVLRDQARRDQVRHAKGHDELTEKDHPAEERTADRVLQAREEIAQVVRALEELPERTRDIFLMRRYEGLAYGDIAERLGISVSAIEKHVAKAVAHIARRMAQ
ncbi:sigma-70 family RNA polymerase sigma factor [Sphingobium scionense]